MGSVRFWHLSDTHWKVDYANSMFASIPGLSDIRSGLERVIDALDASEDRPDFIVISGDLAHEGSVEDYRSLSETLFRIDVPVFVALGNHDRRAPFRVGFLGEEASGHSYDHVETVGEYRIALLDSSVPGSELGDVDESQLAWLRSVLAQPFGRGTLLVMHHPPSFGGAGLGHGIPNPDALFDAIRGGDVVAILSGHTHTNAVSSFGGIPHLTAPSTAFGATADSKRFSFTSLTGFLDCALSGRELSSTFVPCVAPEVYGSVEISALLAAMAKPKDTAA